MVVDDFHRVRIAIAPDKTETPLVINANTMLPFAFTVQRLQSIPRWRCQVAEFCGALQLPKLSARDPLDRMKTPAALAVVKLLSLQTAERPNHSESLYRTAYNVKR